MNPIVFQKFPVLESSRLCLRMIRRGDAPLFYEMRANAEIMSLMDQEPLESLKEARQLIRQYRWSYRKKESLYWALELKETGGFIGGAGYWRLIKPHFRAELGYQLHPGFWGNGYMFEALQAAIDFGFAEFGLHSIEAHINPLNNRSRTLLEKLGFREEAYFRENVYFRGRFSDSVVYSLLPKDFKAARHK